MSVFRFKEFAVDQTDCAMRINTDGVLLGAMAMGDDAETMLDIGTGTGIIALMLAQRFGAAQITGVEIDAISAATASKNAAASPFTDRVQIQYDAFQAFHPAQKLDLIVSNPPFYINALHNPDARKKQARHADMQFFEDLLQYAQTYLSTKGAVEMILPPELAEQVSAMAREVGLHVQRVISISSYADSSCIRQIIRWRKQAESTKAESHDFVIYATKGMYSEEYKSVLQPFFLAF